MILQSLAKVKIYIARSITMITLYNKHIFQLPVTRAQLLVATSISLQFAEKTACSKIFPLKTFQLFQVHTDKEHI